MNQVHIEDMDIMKSTLKRDKLWIASLKHKITRETKRKRYAWNL